MNLPSLPCLILLAAVLIQAGLSPAQESTASGEIVIQRVGFTEDQFPGTATRDAEIAIDYWFKIISDRQKIAQIPNTTVFSTFPQMRQALRNRKLDVISILSLDFLRIRNEVELDPFSVTTRGSDVYTEYAVYVHRGRGIENLAQLAGQKMMIDASEGAELGRFWFDTVLLRQDLDPGDFESTEEVDKASRAVLPVFFGQAAACVAAKHSFENMREMNPRIGIDLVALEISRPLLTAIVCFTPEIDPIHKPDIIQTIHTLHQDPQGQQVLNLFRRDRAVPYHAGQLDSVLALVEERRRLEAHRNIASPFPDLP